MAKVTVHIEDVGGSFATFKREAPREFRAAIHDAVKRTAFAVERRIASNAPVGPDAPHIRDAVSSKVRGMYSEIGFINATQPSRPGSDASMADVATYNEYRPNKQAFMRPAAEAEANDFVKRVKAAAGRAERSLRGGGGLL